MLGDAAGRLRRSADRPELIPALRDQVAWLVAERVGHAPGARPAEFDPSLIKPRERWERLLDVLDPARRLTASLGVTIGVDLVGTPLPRMQVVDDRVVPVGRRHRLPPATFDALPVGQWVSVGPYTAAEWLARGELASGKGAFLRLNKSAYVVAVENGATVAWRLEDVAARTGNGRLATGQSTDLDAVRNDVAVALDGRYPTLAQADMTTTDKPHVASTMFEGGPVKFDYAVAEFADSGDYTRETLAAMIGPRLSDADREALADADHERLSRIVGAAGLTPATTVAVVHADGCPVDTAVRLLPMLGVPMSDAIRALEGRWDLHKVEAARMIGATGAEMRSAGCTATEILALRPDSILRNLPSESHLWELAAGTMATSNHSTIAIVGHLVDHAPSAETFAAGLVAAVDDPTVGIGVASRLRAQPEFIGAASERYGLTPTETAQILRAEEAPWTQALAVVGHRCDFDDAAVLDAWAGTSLEAPNIVIGTSSARPGIRSIGGTDIGTADDLLAMLPHASRATHPTPLSELVAAQTAIPELQLEATKS